MAITVAKQIVTLGAMPHTKTDLGKIKDMRISNVNMGVLLYAYKS